MMDVLQKEADEVYVTHPTAHEALDNETVKQHQQLIRSLTEANEGCAVISGPSNRKSYVTVYPWANLLRLTPEEAALSVIDSMNEDCIYRCIHPEDLVEKRLMEYKFFQKTSPMSPGERLKYRGRYGLRTMDKKGIYQYTDNLVQIMQSTPAGNIWLIFCLYSLSVGQRSGQSIYATITQMEHGEVEALSLSEEHHNILSEREKEILRYIRRGLSSKETAATLYISMDTVNRHRQNILEKFSVGNSIEACRAAELMRLL